MRPIVTFYKPFVFIASFFSLFTCFLLLKWGSPYYSLTLFWIKGLSSVLIGAVFHFTWSEQLSFYHNLGFSTVRLYVLVAMLDAAIWIGAMVFSAQLL